MSAVYQYLIGSETEGATYEFESRIGSMEKKVKTLTHRSGGADRRDPAARNQKNFMGNRAALIYLLAMLPVLLWRRRLFNADDIREN